jgi:predicted nucleic acid-binding protein
MDMERDFVVADTGFIVALLNEADEWHEQSKVQYTHYAPILMPQTVLAEVAYLVGREAGIANVVAFLKGLPESRFRLVSLTANDIHRVAEILDQYADSRIDFVDATVMTIGERYDCRIVLTIDRRDFQIFRPNHCEWFELLP